MPVVEIFPQPCDKLNRAPLLVNYTNRSIKNNSFDPVAELSLHSVNHPVNPTRLHTNTPCSAMSSPRFAYSIPLAAASEPHLAAVHPDVLVAIGAARFGSHKTKGEAWASSNWRDESRPSTAHEGRDADRKRFLDAIASLAVCDAQSQVIAVALKEHPQTGVVVLCVAENGSVNETVVPHIKKLLSVLYKMAHEYRKLEIKSDITPLILKYRTEFIEKVYRHSVLKHLHRYEIRWELVENDLRTTFCDRMGIEDYKLQLLDLVCALEMVRRVHDRIAKGFTVAQQEWVKITVLLDGAMADMKAIRGQYFQSRHTEPVPFHC